MALSGISPLGAPRLPALPSPPSPAGTAPLGRPAASGIAGAAGNGGVGGVGDDFGGLVANALESLQSSQARADRMAVDAATGRLEDVHDYMIAATEASLATELTVAVRNRAVEAFNQIMQMGV